MPEYLQRALAEVLLLSVCGGLLGSWIVLRRLAFFTHAIGSAALPGLVVAGPGGIAPQLTALLSAGALGGGVRVLGRRVPPATATGLLLAGFLALGVLLASDVYESGAGLDRLLFGTLLGVSDTDLLLTGAAVALTLAAHAALHRRWLAQGLDGAPPDFALLAVVAVAVVVSLPAVGALLVIALFVIPAATVRLLTDDLRTFQAGSVALAAAEGTVALFAAEQLNVGPGPMLALLGGAVFAGVALWR